MLRLLEKMSIPKIELNEDNFKKKKNEVINKVNSRNHMQMQKYAIFLKKSLKRNVPKIKGFLLLSK